MAKRRKPAEETSEAVKPSEVIVSISEKKLKALLNFARSTKKDMQELGGQLGQRIANAVENDHLHRKAFSIVRTLDRMEPEKLAECLDCLDHYLDISGIRERASKVQRMAFGPGGETAAEDEDEDEEARQPSTVRPFPRPASVAAE